MTLKAPSMQDAPAFYRNLEDALDSRRKDHALYSIHRDTWKDNASVDFCSNDLISLGNSGMLRKEYMEELARYPDHPLGAVGSRMLDGNYGYLEQVEQEIAEFHGSEHALILGSGFEANLAIYSAIPRPGDAIVYDELVHASIHDGMKKSLATTRVPFRHNDMDSFRLQLQAIKDSQPMIRQGQRCVLVSVESVYSMDGDVCPLKELLATGREVFPLGNIEFFIDESHATGVVGPQGAGLVNKLGLEKDFAIRLHPCGKALASVGAVLLCNATVRTAMFNFARSIIYTTAPPFTGVAAIRSAYNLMRTGRTKEVQDRVQHLVKLFCTTITSDPIWGKANEMGILRVPVSEGWKDKEFFTHLVPIWTKQQYNYYLAFHLSLNGFCAFPITYPVVPKGKARVRITIHAHNTEEQVKQIVAAICAWATEMVEIEAGKGGENALPKAAQQVYAWMAQEAIAELQVGEEKLKVEDDKLKVVDFEGKRNDSGTALNDLPELYMAQSTAA
ncbi:uncharacterized protein N0V89_004542 [Didymosphaeria variabile]|uniref:Aminotransferase class I/classII large domain-containing protein n=1 Tax=Didymosphaeria variabile TaxID=1932322 RepID=A0A9W8XSD1_9PLEO|nr:uncharacterized protein N0V89_004542 [Didymosphaeria variabile]KAJ4356508.1 hypothetical protein N0V89_004542 [Didymosphaeria variabile]